MQTNLKKLCLAALLVAGLFAPASAYGQTKDATLHQVVAGVSQYAPGTQNNLRWADKDARDVAKFWQENGTKMFGRVSGEALVNDQATRQNILNRIDEVIEQARAGDWAVIFLAGHGGSRTLEWNYFAHDDSITATELQKRIARLADKGVTVILILDCCFAGDMAVPATNALVMAACRSGQLSGEGGGIENGRFTHALLLALRGQADANSDGRITLAEVRTFLGQQVTGQQTPMFSLPTGMDDNISLVLQGSKAQGCPERPQR